MPHPNLQRFQASNRPVAVLTDENGCATGPALVASGRITVPTRSEARKEDVRKAAKWNDVAVFSETPVALPAQPKILARRFPVFFLMILIFHFNFIPLVLNYDHNGASFNSSSTVIVAV